MTALVYVVAAVTLAAAGAAALLVWHEGRVVPWLAAKLVMRRSDPDGELERLG